MNTTGYGMIDRAPDGSIRLMDAGTIRTNARDELPARLLELYEGLAGLIRETSPDLIGLEEVFSHYRHPTTAIVMAHARGVLCLVAAMEGVPVMALPATRIKKLLTGNGRASKTQVKGMVRRILGIREDITPDDVSDALAAALAALEEEKRSAGAH